MRALVAEKKGCLVYKDIPIPLYSKDEILVKIKTACICNGSDPAILAGSTWDLFPVVFGHEAFGEVVACGASVTDYSVGDLITWWFAMGAFAEYININPKEIAVLKLPDNIDEKEGPVFELAIAAIRAIEVADVKDKDVLILGLGPSGLIMSQLAKSYGANSVTGYDLYEQRRNLGRRFGCREQGDSFDIVIDAFGDDISAGGQTVNNALKKIRDNGRYVLYGHPERGRNINVYLLQKKNIRVVLPESNIDRVRDLAKKVLALYMSGELVIKPLITKYIPMDEIIDHLHQLRINPQDNVKIIVGIT